MINARYEVDDGRCGGLNGVRSDAEVLCCCCVSVALQRRCIDVGEANALNLWLLVSSVKRGWEQTALVRV